MPAGTPRVRSLHRYPVKSLLGEEVGRLDVDRRGCVGDRRWAVRTAAGKIGSGKNSRRFEAVPGLLRLRGVTRDGGVWIVFPDGTSLAVSTPAAADRLSQHAGRPVTLAAETDVDHFDDGPVSLVGAGSVGALSAERGDDVDVSRFRANIVLDTVEPFVEDRWIGGRVTIGTAILHVAMASPRCVMVDQETADLPAQPGNLLAAGRIHDACLGVVASVVRPGTISLGDAVDPL